MNTTTFPSSTTATTTFLGTNTSASGFVEHAADIIPPNLSPEPMTGIPHYNIDPSSLTTTTASTVIFNNYNDFLPPPPPIFHLNNLPPAHQPPLFQDLIFQSIPGSSGTGFNYSSNQPSLFGSVDGGDIMVDYDYHQGGGGGGGNEGSGGFGSSVCHGQDSGEVFEFGYGDHHMSMGMSMDGDMGVVSGGGSGRGSGSGRRSRSKDLANKGPKNFVTERQRRENLCDKYSHLKALVPNPTKGDRASIVGDAIEYIKELNRRVKELQTLVAKKRYAKTRAKRHKNNIAVDQVLLATTADDHNSYTNGQDHMVNKFDPSSITNNTDNNINGGDIKPEVDESFDNIIDGSLRSSWIQRKYKDTEFDVRIVDDEVTIKLVQRKKGMVMSGSSGGNNCLLLFVSTTLDDLQLELRHVAGGHVGDYYSFLFNSKICEGSSVYASAIANRLIDVVERQYATTATAAIPPSVAY